MSLSNEDKADVQTMINSAGIEILTGIGLFSFLIIGAILIANIEPLVKHEYFEFAKSGGIMSMMLFVLLIMGLCDLKTNKHKERETLLTIKMKKIRKELED